MESAPTAPEVPVLGATDEVPAALEPTLSQVLVTAPLTPTVAPPLLGSFAPVAILEHAFSEMTQLQADLLNVDLHLVAGSLELASGWLHSDLAVCTALGRAVASSEREKQDAAGAAADREAAQKDVDVYYTTFFL